MKNILKYLCVCLLFSACASVPILEETKSFVVLHTKDTIFGKIARGEADAADEQNVFDVCWYEVPIIPEIETD